MSTVTNQSEKQNTKAHLILISFLIAGFSGLFSETALNMAIKDLTEVFQISSSTAQWLTTGYLLTMGILVPISGLLIQWFSTRHLFIVSLLFSISGTLIAALAPNFGILLLSRLIQAVGTSLLLPLMFNTVLLIYPVRKRGAIMGIMGLVIIFAPAISPTVSGLILEYLSWHWIFWITLPIFVIALLFGIKHMQNVSTITKPTIDILSIILSSIGFGGIVYGFGSASENGWGDIIIISTISIGLVGLISFSIRQFKIDKPMLDLRVFKYPMFTIGVSSVAITFMIIMSSMILLPLYLQTGLSLAAFSAGLVLLPGGIMNGLMAPISGRIFDKFGPRVVVIPGFFIMAIMLWNLSNVTTETSIFIVMGLHTLLMFGVSMVMMPVQTNGLNQLPKNLYPDGSALINTLQQVSGAIGTAVAITIMSASQNTYMDRIDDPLNTTTISKSLAVGVQDAVIFGLVIAIIGLIMSLFIKPSTHK